MKSVISVGVASIKNNRGLKELVFVNVFICFLFALASVFMLFY